jgi:hypothetical protein
VSRELEQAVEMALQLGKASPEEARRVRAALQGGTPARERMLTTRTAADALDVHPKTVLHYGRSGLLHPVRRSARHLRWKASEVERLALEGAEA